jgi:hypothetical protein
MIAPSEPQALRLRGRKATSQALHLALAIGDPVRHAACVPWLAEEDGA